MNTSRSAIAKKLLDDLTPMRRQPVPDHGQLAVDVLEKMTQKTHDIRATNRPILHPHQQPSLSRDAADGREVFVEKRSLQHGRLPARSIGAYHRRQHVKTRLINENHRSVLRFGFFLMRDQSSSTQRSMAASSRWVARSTGFCRLQSILAISRPTCESL